MYFNRRNTEQKNWRMIKKGKHFLFGCSLVLAVGASFVASSVKADTVEPQPESSSTNEEGKLTSKEESGSGTYVAPAATVASTTATETNTAPATDEKPKEESETTVEKSKESDAIQAPSLTMVADPAALTEEEKANVVEAVKGVKSYSHRCSSSIRWYCSSHFFRWIKCKLVSNSNCQSGSSSRNFSHST